MKWISVKDLMPKGTGHVLVVANDTINQWQEVLNCYLCPEYEDFTWEFLSGEEYSCIVTHWMLLPAQPNDIEE